MGPATARRPVLRTPAAALRRFAPAPLPGRVRLVGRLDDVDLTQSLGTKEYERLLAARSWRLAQLRLALGGKLGDGGLGPGLLVLFEGWDSAGKGGAIKRLVAPLDARHVRVVQYAAPTRRREAALLPQPLRPAAPRPRRHGRLRPHVVRPRARRADRGLRDRRAVAARLRGDRRLRALAVPRGDDRREVLDPPLQGGAAAAVQVARGRSAEALEAHRRGLAQPRALGRVRRRPSRRWSTAPTRPGRRGTSSPATTRSSRASP